MYVSYCLSNLMFLFVMLSILYIYLYIFETQDRRNVLYDNCPTLQTVVLNCFAVEIGKIELLTRAGPHYRRPQAKQS